MNIIKGIICIIALFSKNVKAYGKEYNHLCEETVTRLTDDGHTYHDKILVCCPGYIIDTSGKCIPLCERPCIYGFCKSPNVCECIEGYKMIKNECVPTCERKCVNGFCRKPEVCGCLNGFELDAKNLTYCVPICKPKCKIFSKCTKIESAQNRCECISGYKENKNTKTCEPICTNKCHNGFCSAPEICECFSGFELDNSNKTRCIPRCEPNCQLFSSCIAPDICVCDNGYNLNKISKKCEPICRDQVKNSRCVKPNTWICIENYQHDRKIDKCVLESCLCNGTGYCLENEDTCECYEGFIKNSTTGLCQSKCVPNCKNSICVSNVCQCFDGYHKTYHDHICEHNGFCNGLPCENGICLITGECKCKEGYVKSFSYNGQIQCEKVETFILKFMTAILGVPMLLATFTLIALYVVHKKKSYNVEEQEMMLIDRR